jgi:hypothetical protein
MRNLVLTAVLALAFGQPAIAQTALDKMRKADQQKAQPNKAQGKMSAREKKKRDTCNRQADQKKVRATDRPRFVENCVKG